MIATKSNVLFNITPTIDDPADDVDPIVLTDGDFSSRYTAAIVGGDLVFTYDLGAEFNIDHFAIGGSNAATKDTVTVETSTDGILWDTQGTYSGTASNEQSTLFFSFAEIAVQYIRLSVFGSGSVTISDTVAGLSYEIPNGGEQGGYMRPWSISNVEVRQASSLDGAPVSLVYKARINQCTLTVPNLIFELYDEFKEWERYASLNTFYILEDDDPTHSYACWNSKFKMLAANSQTRKINQASVTFNAYAKISEAYA